MWDQGNQLLIWKYDIIKPVNEDDGLLRDLVDIQVIAYIIVNIPNLQSFISSVVHWHMQEDSEKTGKVTSAGMYFLHFQVYRMDTTVNAVCEFCFSFFIFSLSPIKMFCGSIVGNG